MEQSILTSTKKVCGLAEDHTEFDEDLVMNINAALGVLYQLGIGDQGMFTIEDAEAVWEDYGIPTDQLALAKQYIFLSAKLVFDAPATSYHLDASNKRLKELEKRINMMREEALSE